MKRRLLAIAVASPIVAAPVLMTAAERGDQIEATPVSESQSVRTAALDTSLVVTPATHRPLDASELELPTLDEGAADRDAATDQTLLEHIALLETAAAKIERIAGYTAELTKQERLDGVLGSPEVTELKVRHDAFSVYMRWTKGDRGREVLYSEGAYDDEMLVHPGGWKGRFLPTLSVDPNGSLALGQSRHAITEAGLKNLVGRHLEQRRVDLGLEGVTASTAATTFDGRPATELTVSYAEEGSNEYQRTVLLFDDGTGLPVASRNYGWTAIDREGDEATLVERYEYRNIDIDAELTATDFDRANRSYNFR